ncbi:MAG TPA: ABC transporter permease [Candidatus Limnocylindrales bacterium]|nr:ABC transporter permease [Candidatus Limnocylindrales bacterium]
MTRFIVRRLLVTIPVLFGIVFFVFALARLIPGDPCRAVLGERATDEVCDAFIVRYGLDQPIPVQFGLYVQQLASGDLGDSIKHSRPVTQLLIERLPTTIELTFWAMVLAIVVGVPLGLLSAIRHNSAVDVGTMVFANIGVSMPVFVLGLLLAFLFAITFKDTPLALPPSGRLSSGVTVRSLADVWGLTGLTGLPRGLLDFLSGIYTISALITGQFGAWVDAMRHLILPAVALGTIPLAIIARITRSSLLEVLGQDYVRTARAKGLRERGVVLRHAARNALLPIVTVIGLQLGGLLSGAVLTETVFNLAGVGRTMFEAITGRDYVVIQGLTLMIAVFYVAINLIVDIAYGFLDPRVRYA